MTLAPRGGQRGAECARGDDGRRRLRLLHPPALRASPGRRSPSSSTARGPCVQQMAYRVEDLGRQRHPPQARARLLYPEPKRGTSDSPINFIHPKDAGGILVELVDRQRTPGTRAHRPSDRPSAGGRHVLELGEGEDDQRGRPPAAPVRPVCRAPSPSRASSPRRSGAHPASRASMPRFPVSPTRQRCIATRAVSRVHETPCFHEVPGARPPASLSAWSLVSLPGRDDGVPLAREGRQQHAHRLVTAAAAVPLVPGAELAVHEPLQPLCGSAGGRRALRAPARVRAAQRCGRALRAPARRCRGWCATR